MELQDCCSQVENKTTGEKIGFTNELEDDKHSLNSEKSASKKLNSNQLIDSAPVEFKTIETGEIKCYSFIKRQKFLPWIEKVVLISICVAVAGGFSVPIIMYAVSEDDSSAGNTTTIGKSDNFMIDFDSCSHTIPQVCIPMKLMMAQLYSCTKLSSYLTLEKILNVGLAGARARHI